MITLIVIGAILGYIMLGLATAKLATLMDPGIFHDQFKEAINGKSETSVPVATTTIIFWPMSLAIMIIIVIGIMIYHTGWKWWGMLIRKVVG